MTDEKLIEKMAEAMAKEDPIFSDLFMAADIRDIARAALAVARPVIEAEVRAQVAAEQRLAAEEGTPKWMRQAND